MEPIKLGKIVDGKVVEMSDSCVWDLDYTLAIVIRDYLTKLANTTNSYPACLSDWGVVDAEEEKKISDEQRHTLWVNLLLDIANKFDLYLKPADDFLSEEDKAFRAYYFQTHLIENRSDGVPQEDADKLHIIFDKINRIEQMKVEKVREAFNDVGKIFPTLWD